MIVVRDGVRDDLEHKTVEASSSGVNNPKRSINKLKHITVLCSEKLRFVKGGWGDSNYL